MTMETELASVLGEVDWDLNNKYAVDLGSLSQLLHVVTNDKKVAGLEKLATICASIRATKEILLDKPSLHAVLVVSGFKHGEGLAPIEIEQLHKFYLNFFLPEVTEAQMVSFLYSNVSIAIVRREYYQKKQFGNTIVGSITFTQPGSRGEPVYLAYFAVSDGLQGLVSLTDKGIHVVPDTARGNPDYIGYQGYGLGSLLLVLMQRVVKSHTLHRMAPPYYFLHYNSINVGCARGWLRHGFHTLDSKHVVTVQATKKYKLLCKSRLKCPVFQVSHVDTVNCVLMVTRSPGVRTDKLKCGPKWYTDFDSTVRDEFLAKSPSEPAYQLHDTELEQKYARRIDEYDSDSDGDDPTPASLEYILEMAVNRKEFVTRQHERMQEYAEEDEEGGDDEEEGEESTDTEGTDPPKLPSNKPRLTSWRKDLLPNSDDESSSSESSQSAHPSETDGSEQPKPPPKPVKKRRTARLPLQKKRRKKKCKKQKRRFWSDQDYIDYACLQDPNRTLALKPNSLRTVGREQLIVMVVPSYDLPPNVHIENAEHDHHRLESADHEVRCDWRWLKKEVVPEVAQVLEEALFGLPVVSGIGLNHPDSSVGRREVASLASFLGATSHERNFVSPPAMHKLITLPGNDFKVDCSNGYPLEQLKKHKSETHNFELHVRSLQISTPPPPLPREKYQISRLKWIPTEDPEATDEMMYDKGYFQGSYRISETNQFSIVSMKDEWVIHEFDPTYLRDVKEQGVTGMRASHKFIVIPPGESKKKALPPASLLHYMRKSAYQQGSNSTCLLDSLSSAMAEFGCIQQVELLRNHVDCKKLSQSNVNLMAEFGNQVNRQFKGIGLQMFRQKNKKTVEDLLTCDDMWVVVAVLKASDGMEGQHAVCLFNGGIYDANCKFVLKKSKAALDWCCGDGAVSCTGIFRSYQMKPLHQEFVPPSMRYLFQTRNKDDRNVRGWVVSTQEETALVQFTDGRKEMLGFNEIKAFTRLN